MPGVSSGSETDYQGETWFRMRGLEPDVLYRFQIQAYNSYGDGEWSAVSYALHTPAVPEAPEAPQVTNKSHNAISLRWAMPKTRGTVDCPDVSLRNPRAGVCTTAGQGAAVTGYLLYVSYGATDVWEPLGMPETGLAIGRIEALSYEVIGCKPSLLYGFRVAALNAAGEGPMGAPLFVSTNTVPDAPNPPQFYSKTHSSIALMWEPPRTDAGSPVLAYRLFGSRWDWEAGWWVPIEPSVLSVKQRARVAYEDLVVEPGESPYPWPEEIESAVWGELALPPLDTLQQGYELEGDIALDDSGSGSWSESWDWAEGAVSGGQTLEEWRGRRQQEAERDDPDDLQEFQEAGWSDHASQTVVEQAARRRLEVNASNYAHSAFIRGGEHYRRKPNTLPAEVLYYNVEYLMNNEYYRWIVVAINAAGQGPVSFRSEPNKLLDAPITDLQIFSGPPCMYNFASPTNFLAVSDGSGVFYRWTTDRGSTTGRCLNEDCSLMDYSYVQPGVNTITLTAINNVGSMVQTQILNVSYCGCTDRDDPNFWWLATYHLPELCSNIETWPNVDKRVAMGETKFFDLPIPADAFHTELVIRVETGAVGVYISKSRLPDILSNVTYDQRFVGPEIKDDKGNATGTYKGIETFAVMDTWYHDLSASKGGKLSGAKWLFIAVVGFQPYSQFELVGKVTQFIRGVACQGENICMQPSTRGNLQNPVYGVELLTPYYDFYEYYFETAAVLTTIDVQVTITVLQGCVQVYASQSERYPSPKRAGGIQHGYITDKTVGGCASMVTHTTDENGEGGRVGPMAIVFNIEAHHPRVLYLSVQSADMDNLITGQMPPTSIYDLAVEAFDYSASSEVVLGKQTMDAGEAVQDVVILDNFRFFEIRISDAATTVEVTVTAIFGKIDLFISAIGNPTQSVYDVRVQDSDEDGVVKHRLNFADIELEGFFYIGIFGRDTSSSFLVNVVEERLEADDVTTVITQEIIENEDVVNGTCCGPTLCTAGQVDEHGEEVECTDLQGYMYYLADRRILAQDQSTNTTVDITTEVVEENDETTKDTVFDWIGPYTEEYLDANFNSRTQDLIIELDVEGLTYDDIYYPASVLGDSQFSTLSPLYAHAQQPVYVTVYASSLDPFPGMIRTYDVLMEMDLRVEFQMEVVIPLFKWSGMPVHFSIHCEQFQLHYSFVIREVKFDRSILLSEDPPLPPSLCAGQQFVEEGDLMAENPPCSGHGSCVGYAGEDSPLAATCFCNQGWLGPDCSVERFPAWPLITIISPNASGTVDGTVEGGVRVQYITQLHPNDTMTYFWNQKAYWNHVELVLYVDGRPYPQPYPNNVFPTPLVNDTIPTDIAIHNLADGAPHNLQLYVMYAPEYAVLQIISLDFYLGTVGAGCTEESDCSHQGVCYRGYCVCFDGFIGTDCSLEEEFYRDSWIAQQNGSAGNGFRDRLVTALDRKALGVGYETSVMVEATRNYMNKQDGSLLVRLQDAIDQVNGGRAWNEETVEYFLKTHGNEAETKAVERASSLQELRQQFNDVDLQVRNLKKMLSGRRDYVHNLRKAVEAKLRQLHIDYEWEKRVKYSEWRMVKERALFSMLKVRSANGPRVPIDQLQQQVCTKDNKFRTECHYEDLAEPIVAPLYDGNTELMTGFDIEGETYAEYIMHDTWDESTQVAVCNATCYGHVDPCDSPVLASIFGLSCNSDALGQFMEIGLGFCRDRHDTKPNGYYKRVASRKLCATYCTVGPTCLGYAWSKDGQCYLYYSDFVGRAGTDFAGFYEHWHVVPTGWSQFLPQGRAGSMSLAGSDGIPTRRCYVKDGFLWTDNGNTTEPEPEPEPEPEELAPSPPANDWMSNSGSGATFEPSELGSVTNIGSETNVTNATACWTGQQFRTMPDYNVGVGSVVEAIPPGDVDAASLVDANLDRNWHSVDEYDGLQQIHVLLPGNDQHHKTFYCISGLKLYWRNAYTAKAYKLSSSTDGFSYTRDLLEGVASNLTATAGRIDEYNFALHDARHVLLNFTQKQMATTLDYDLLELEVYGMAGKCNDTFGHEPNANSTNQLEMLQRMAEANGEDAGTVGTGAEAGSVEVESTYSLAARCATPPGEPAIDRYGDWNCGPLSRTRLVEMCTKIQREPLFPSPPMDPGPKNLLEYLGLEWEMREAMLAQSCQAWDVIRPSESDICHGEVVSGWDADSMVPTTTILRAHVCPTSGRENPTCRLFSRADSYHPDSRTISGARNTIAPKKTIYRYDGFEEQPGYTSEVLFDSEGNQDLMEGMANNLYHDVPR